MGVVFYCPGSVVIEFNPISGELTNENCLPYAIKQVVLLPMTDHTHQRNLLLFDQDGTSHCYVGDCGLQSTTPMFLYTADINSGTLEGVAVKGVESSTIPAWRTVIPKNEKILKIINNRYGKYSLLIRLYLCLYLLGHTHSLGRVRYDRSVQYKYLNPHLVAMATQTIGQSKRMHSIINSLLFFSIIN